MSSASAIPFYSKAPDIALSRLIRMKTQVVDGIEVLFSADWINDLESELHFNWYWHQANLVYKYCSRDQNLVEIGIGTSLLSDLLRRRGWRINTLDIDKAKAPNFCESADEFDYAAHEVDVVLAFEIFEHIPLSTFEKVLAKLSQSKVKCIYFSLPWCESSIASISFKLPKLKRKCLSLSVPRKTIRTAAHFWELSKKEVSLGEKQLVSQQRLQSLLLSHGYSCNALEKIGYIQYFAATNSG